MNAYRIDPNTAQDAYIGTDPARLVYIKPLDRGEARALGIIPEGIKLPKNVQLFAIHSADGARIAVMDGWDAAYGAALENEFRPVSIH